MYFLGAIGEVAQVLDVSIASMSSCSIRSARLNSSCEGVVGVRGFLSSIVRTNTSGFEGVASEVSEECMSSTPVEHDVRLERRDDLRLNKPSTRPFKTFAKLSLRLRFGILGASIFSSSSILLSLDFDVCCGVVCDLDESAAATRHEGNGNVGKGCDDSTKDEDEDEED